MTECRGPVDARIPFPPGGPDGSPAAAGATRGERGATGQICPGPAAATEGPWALAASRTAPATAPATLSLKTLGTM